MEGAIRAIIRIYALDVFLRAAPIFTAFEINDVNYDNLLESFIAERMRQGLYEDGVRRSNATDEEYYFRFIEQVVNNTVRKLQERVSQVQQTEILARQKKRPLIESFKLSMVTTESLLANRRLFLMSPSRHRMHSKDSLQHRPQARLFRSGPEVPGSARFRQRLPRS
jgi:hypothetical protein